MANGGGVNCPRCKSRNAIIDRKCILCGYNPWERAYGKKVMATYHGEQPTGKKVY